MALQSTNRVKISKTREATFAITPANPVFKTLRETSSSLNANPKTVITQEIRSDRQVTDLILVDMDAGGDVGGEIAFGVADDDFEEALQGTWSNNPAITVVTANTEISALSATTATVAAGGASFVAAMLTLLSGFPTAANNKLARVSSSTATTIVYPAATFTAETAPIPVGAAIRTVGFEGASGDLAAVTAGGNGLQSTALDFTTLPGLAAGRWIKLGDGDNAGHSLATTACNGFCRISSVATNKLSFDIVPAGWAADTGTGVSLRAFMGDVLVNGSNIRTNTIERQYLDHSPVDYEYFVGQALNVLKVDAKAGAIATYTRTYLGKTASITPTRVSGATDQAAPTYGILNTSSNVGRIGFNGSTITGPNFVLAANFDINNNLRAQKAVGNIGAVGIGNGEFTVTGQLQTYFGDASVYNQILNNTKVSFDMRVGRADGNRESLLFDFPAIKLSSGAPAVPGKNQDVTLQANFQAIMSATLGYTVLVTRFWYLPTS
ncbi:phage tail tube protein [Bradyrhizobium sp. SZCCHNR1020]|uniref:phage tail tube protein n=1 Tax=Bradyrhizobium sp. SZCCHNR1020 TaxID=3057343 RepID=UPI0029160726|nr:phage tail tube protein [Bradyrhizobium sp. SZCCHNR1020]